MIAIVVMPERSPPARRQQSVRHGSILARRALDAARAVADRLGDVRRRHAGALRRGRRSCAPRAARDGRRAPRDRSRSAALLEQAARAASSPPRGVEPAAGRARVARVVLRSAGAAGGARARRARGSPPIVRAGPAQASRARLTAGTGTCRSMRSASGPERRAAIAQHLGRGAHALRARIAGVAARARVHRRDEREARGERAATPCARAMVTRPSSIGWRSASSTCARELGQLVQEEHAVMREAHLAGARRGAAADQAGGGDRVVRRAERPRA